MKRPKTKNVKEKKLDQIFSLLVRTRTNFFCERCHTNSGQAQCSHLFGRRSRNLRFDIDNCVTHCATCHRYLTENPLIFGEWMIEFHGEEKVQELRVKSNTTRKRSQPEIRDLHERMKSELKRMERLRDGGETGRINFTLED